MITYLNNLPTEEKLNLLKTFSPTTALQVLDADDQVISESLVAVLKREFKIAADKDFGIKFRNLLVRICLQSGAASNTDLLSDMDLADKLVDWTIQQAASMNVDETAFFRTKRPEEQELAKTAAATRSPEALALIAGAAYMTEGEGGVRYRARHSMVVQNVVKFCAFMAQELDFAVWHQYETAN